MQKVGYLVVVVAVVVACLACFSSATPLDDYVNMPDDSYKFEVITSFTKKDAYTVHVINMTSQTWLTKNQSSKPTWVHWLLVCVPAISNRYDNVGLIYINGDSNTDSVPTSLSEVVELVCLESHGITAELRQIPNEPVKMGNETYYRTEDAIIAYTWRAFFNDTDEVYWPLHLPMTKATVRAMDTIQQLPQYVEDFPLVPKFVIAGASKRGWTTWLTGAVDERVIGLAPIVIDILNMSSNLNHQWQAYGAWTFAFDDYVDEGVTHYLNKPQMTLLANIEDPITYVDRYTRMPIFAICATGDEFFLPDSPQFFWNYLLGPKWLRMLPNAEHSLAGHATDIATNINTFFHAITTEMPLPVVNWTISNTTGEIVAVSTEKPIKARMWHAKNLHHRDFRLIVCGDMKNISCYNPILWDFVDLEPNSTSGGLFTYQALKPAPPTGWGGFFIELHFQIFTFQRDEIKFTTEVSILPTTLPFPPCGQNC